MKIGIVGNNDGPLALLRALRNLNHEIAFCGLQKEPDSELLNHYQRMCQKHYFFTSFDEDALLETTAEFNIDLLINCFCNFRFVKLLHQGYKVLNIHLSLLPKYRGRHPLQWALINGEKKTGYTIHEMNADWDAGPILWQKAVTIERGASLSEVRSKIVHNIENDFPLFLSNYTAGSIEPLPNSNDHATLAPRRTPEESSIDPFEDSEYLYRKIMALRSESYPAYLPFKRGDVVCLYAEAPVPQHMPVEQGLELISESTFELLSKNGKKIKIATDQRGIDILYQTKKHGPEKWL